MFSIEIPPDQIWMVVVGFIIAFVLAFGIGANDVANSFGTSVGAKVLNLKQACILACIFETLGAVLLGAKVSDTIRKGIIDVTPYQNETSLLMVGNVAALTGSCVWLMAATMLRLPVSATHSIVGATVGFALVAHGVAGINWTKFGMIIGSWFISPLMAGLVSTGLFYLSKYFILNKSDPLEPGLRFLPIFYAGTIVINLFSVFYDGPEMLGFDKIPLWGTFVLSFGSGLITAVVVRFVIVPWQRRRIKAHCAKESGLVATADDEKKCRNSFEDDSKTAVDSMNGNVVTAADKPVESVDMSSNGSGDFLHPEHADAATNFITANEKNVQNNVNAKALICKSEDASLLNNEYKLGSITPTKNTTTDLNSELINGYLSPASEEAAAKKLADSPSDSPNGSIDAENAGINKGDLLLEGRTAISDRPETARLFSFLQILTAVFGAFAHGGNDVSNAIGPLVSLWLVATTGVVTGKAATPPLILLYGGIGISLGLCVLGRRVIKTIGEDLTKITPSSGFCIEIGSALTVLIASNVGIPISTTHCKVGSVVIVGRFRSRENVDWSIFRNIVLAWLVTLPISGGISAAIMAGLSLLVK